MTVRDRVRGVPVADLCARYSAAELHSMRESLRTERDESYRTVTRIADAAQDRPLTNAQRADQDAAIAATQEAGELIVVIEDAIAGHERADGQDVVLAITDPNDPAAARGARFGARHAYVEGAPLQPDQSVVGFVRSRGEVREGDDGRSLRKFLRGGILGEWHDAGRERRAMAEAVLSTGGFMIPQILSAELIDLARNSTRVLRPARESCRWRIRSWIWRNGSRTLRPHGILKRL